MPRLPAGSAHRLTSEHLEERSSAIGAMARCSCITMAHSPTTLPEASADYFGCEHFTSRGAVRGSDALPFAAAACYGWLRQPVIHGHTRARCVSRCHTAASARTVPAGARRHGG